MTPPDTPHPFHFAGLDLASDFALPGLSPATGRVPAVLIRRGAVPTALTGDRNGAPHAETTPGEVLLLRPPHGRILVRDGREMVVQEGPDGDRRALAEHVMGPGLATLVQQRGHLVLHANVVAHPDAGCVALVGGRRRGKSTLSVLLRMFGYELWADDTAVITWNADGATVVHAGTRRAKLTRAAAAGTPALGRKREYVPSFEKFVEVTDPPDSPEGPRVLRHVVLLERGRAERFSRVDPVQATRMLAHHVYGRRRVAGMGLSSSTFRQCVRLAGSVPMARYRRRFKETTALESAAALASWLRDRAVEAGRSAELHYALAAPPKGVPA